MKKLLKSIYKARYDQEDEKKKKEIWKILVAEFLQKFIQKEDSVLDIAAGHCEFINSIKAKKKYALDIDDRIKKYADPDVEIIISDAAKIPHRLAGQLDTVFMGCLLEHMPSKQAIIDLFLSIKKVLKKNGKLLILNPNIRFSTSDYWDYFDHITPVSDRSIVEVLKALGFEIELSIARFVPNTIKDSLPKSLFLVRLYLKLPFLYPLFGKQMFIVAKKP